MNHNFKIIYHNPLRQNTKTDIEVDEDYNFDWAFSDYEPVDAQIEIYIGDYSLKLSLERFGYPLFMDLQNLITTFEDNKPTTIPFKNDISDANPNQKIAHIAFFEFMQDIPIIFFVLKDEHILIYTRTYNRSDNSAFVQPNTDQKDPITVSKKTMEREIYSFLISYFSDVTDGIPGIEKSTGYDQMNAFISKLKQLNTNN